MKCSGRAYRTTFDYVNWILITLVTLWTLTFVSVDLFSCGLTPSANWEVQHSWESVCVDTLVSMTVLAVINWVIDLVILLEPLFMVRFEPGRRLGMLSV